jgi:DNA-nicking Smr family endonuclease
MDNEIIKIDLDDELDLHHFDPKDAKAVLNEFIEIALSKGRSKIRIIHGKGRSVIKSIVLKELSLNNKVISFKDDGSNWGSTIANLKINNNWK